MKTETNGFNDLMTKFNRLGYKKKDNYPDLPQTPRKQRNSWLGRLLYTDGVPVWKYEPFRMAIDRWGQLKDPRWIGWVKGLWNFILYAVFSLGVLWYMMEKQGFSYGNSQVWMIAVPLAVAWGWLLLQPTIGEVQDNSYIYDQPRGKIVKNEPENISFRRHMDYHTRTFLIKMIFPLGYVIIAWILNGGTFFTY